ncbi:MAG: TPM domain-containing protein [Betaproteobacteria bacterium]
MHLSRSEADVIEARTAHLEAQTGVQVATAVVGKSDHYAEIPWKAFALGAALAALAVVAFDALHPDWVSSHAALAHALAILGTGAADALLAIFIPAYGRVFLSSAHAADEVRHYAESMFLRRRMFDSRGRNGILVLISCFERRVEIIADTGLDSRVGAAQWRTVVDSMTPHLVAGNVALALQGGLQRLEQILRDKGLEPAWDDRNDIADRPIEERGAK